MTRAEEVAMKIYPNVEQPVWDESYPKTLFVRHTERNAFIKGYEQAEKDLALMWKEKIRSEIERLKEAPYFSEEDALIGYDCALSDMLSIIDSIPDHFADVSKMGEAPKGYDEAYLNECIAKASKTWKGVDVDKFMDEVRGRESDDLKEAAREWAEAHYKDLVSQQVCADDFIAGAEWQREQDKPITGNSLEKEWLRYVNKKKKEYGGELPSLGDYGWLQIARHFAEWQKEQMMKDAVEGEICGRVYDHINVRFANGICKYLEPKNISHIPADVSKYKPGQKVKILIIKDDDK